MVVEADAPGIGAPLAGGDGRVCERRAFVLAGGEGIRLRESARPIAGAPIPKSYSPIPRERSLLEATRRVTCFAPADGIRTCAPTSMPTRGPPSEGIVLPRAAGGTRS
jgi:hypothetical protein